MPRHQAKSRDAVLFVRLTTREHRALIRAAEKLGLNLTAYSRLVLLRNANRAAAD